MTYLIRGLGFQKRMRNYLYKGNSARIYMLFKFYRTAIFVNIFHSNPTLSTGYLILPPKPVKYVTLSPCPLLPCLPLPYPQTTCLLVNLSNPYVLSTQHQYAQRYQLPVHFPLGRHDAYLMHLPYDDQGTC